MAGVRPLPPDPMEVPVSRALPLLLLAACGLPPGDHDAYTVRSAHTGSRYAVRTFVPEGADRRTAPQLVVLDGDWHAVPAFLEAGREGHDPVVVVTIGYEDDNARIRDFTPTALDAVEGSGGLDAFVAALEEELLPGTPGDAEARVWFGHSLGGLAVTDLWLHRPDLAERVIAASPALYWDDALPIAEARDHGGGGDLFLTASAQEGWGIPASTARMADTLGASATLETYRGPEHTGTVVPSLRDGLTHFFGGR